MNVPRLNLLRHQRQGLGNMRGHRPALMKGVVLGLVVGLVLLVWAELWQTQRVRDLQAQRTQLQSQLQQAQTRLAQQTQARMQAQAMKRVAQRERDTAHQRERLTQLQTVWETRAQNQGWQVQRWQVDARGLTLQLWMPQAQALPELTQALSQVGPSSWSLQQLATHSQGGVQAVLQASWPASPISAAQTDQPTQPTASDQPKGGKS